MKRKIGIVFVIIGIILILCAAGLLCYNTVENRNAEKRAAEITAELESAADVEEAEESDEMDAVYVDGNWYVGKITIPVLDRDLPVMQQWSYDGLRISPGRYSGSIKTNNLVICGHNNTSHFGTLKYLKDGDEVYFTDVNGDVYSYAVDYIDTLGPYAVEEMTSGDWDLTLFTCTVGGRTRVTVRCYSTD